MAENEADQTLQRTTQLDLALKSQGGGDERGGQGEQNQFRHGRLLSKERGQ